MRLLRIVLAILIVLLVGYALYETKSPFVLFALLFLAVVSEYGQRLTDITFSCPQCGSEFVVKEKEKK